MNKYIREHINVRRKVYYKRTERLTLKEFLSENKSRAIICVTGHYIYADEDTYYLFFNNDNNEVICVWYLI